MKTKKLYIVTVMVLLTAVVCGALGACKSETPPHTHTYGSWSAETAATCTAAGEERRYCKGDACEEFETRETAPLGHDMRDGVCTRCGYTENTNVHQHTFSAWQQITAANCTDSGWERRSCQRDGCEEFETRAVAALGHNLINGTCSRCGYHESGGEVPADMIPLVKGIKSATVKIGKTAAEVTGGEYGTAWFSFVLPAGTQMSYDDLYGIKTETDRDITYRIYADIDGELLEAGYSTSVAKLASRRIEGNYMEEAGGRNPIDDGGTFYIETEGYGPTFSLLLEEYSAIAIPGADSNHPMEIAEGGSVQVWSDLSHGSGGVTYYSFNAAARGLYSYTVKTSPAVPVTTLYFNKYSVPDSADYTSDPFVCGAGVKSIWIQAAGSCTVTFSVKLESLTVESFNIIVKGGLDGSEVMDTQTLEYGSAYHYSGFSLPEIEGYDLDYFTDGAGVKYYGAVSIASVTKSRTFTAVYKESMYIRIAGVPGGYMIEPGKINYFSNTNSYSASISSFNIPVIEGYRFYGFDFNGTYIGKNAMLYSYTFDDIDITGNLQATALYFEEKYVSFTHLPEGISMEKILLEYKTDTKKFEALLPFPTQADGYSITQYYYDGAYYYNYQRISLSENKDINVRCLYVSQSAPGQTFNNAAAVTSGGGAAAVAYSGTPVWVKMDITAGKNYKYTIKVYNPDGTALSQDCTLITVGRYKDGMEYVEFSRDEASGNTLVNTLYYAESFTGVLKITLAGVLDATVKVEYEETADAAPGESFETAITGTIGGAAVTCGYSGMPVWFTMPIAADTDYSYSVTVYDADGMALSADCVSITVEKFADSPAMPGGSKSGNGNTLIDTMNYPFSFTGYLKITLDCPSPAVVSVIFTLG